MSKTKDAHIGFMIRVLAANLMDYEEGKSDHNDSTFILDEEDPYKIIVKVSIEKKPDV